ncbi:unnamed protein product, partial [Didymodactylos carnosus]
TPLKDLNSKFGFDLRRQMLHKLANKDSELWPNDAEKCETIYQKYKQYQIPKEEIDWIGLLPDEAVDKLEAMETDQLEKSIRPWKESLRENLVKTLAQRVKDGQPIDIKLVEQKP